METITVIVKYLDLDDKLSVSILDIQWDTVTYIDASWKNIGDLKWMKKCPNLQKLHLYHNNLISLSGLPEGLPNLQYLSLHNNNLSLLSGLPQELPNLQHLDLYNNKLNSLVGLTEELPNLQYLNIWNNDLSSLEGLPEELPNLQYLNIWNNNLSTLEGLPKELPNLKTLSLYINNLSSPSGLPQELPNLQNLDLSNNKLNSLKGLTEELPNLQYLSLSNNNLSSLSDLPQELPNLLHLNIWINNLSSLSDLPEELLNLQYLNLQYNKLSSLSGLPQELPSLQHLDLSSNELSSLEGLPKELPNLQRLYIPGNAQITKLPNYLINYRNLQLLNYDDLGLELEPRIRRWLNRLQNRHIRTTTQVYGNSQNVHDSSIQETVRQSMRKLLDQPNIPKQCLDTLRSQIVQDTILTPKSKDQLLEYIESDEELHELCLTYGDLLWVVWQTIHGYSNDIQCEIKEILNQELQDSDCKCFTGRMTRLVNCLNGFCDLVEIKILDSSQISNILLLIKQKLEQNEEGYSVVKHREEFREEMLSRGESDEVIEQWIAYID